jgi:hypothetical protein
MLTYRKTPLDLTITSSGRPDLLEITLEGLTKKLLPKVCFGSVSVNIDPIPETSPKENLECLEIIKRYFPDAVITLTESPSFGLAIQKLWGGPFTSKSSYFLHFEDDWNSIRQVNLSAINRMLNKHTRTRQVVLRKEVKSMKRSLFRFNTRLIEFNGGDIKIPSFSTGPSFINKSFAVKISRMIKPQLHPEKQMVNMSNPELTSFLREYKCRKYIWAYRKEVILDLGVEWYKNIGYDRTYINGVPTYVKRLVE